MEPPTGPESKNAETPALVNKILDYWVQTYYVSNRNIIMAGVHTLVVLIQREREREGGGRGRGEKRESETERDGLSKVSRALELQKLSQYCQR